jgi:PAS domain S-box-containing protein
MTPTEANSVSTTMWLLIGLLGLLALLLPTLLLRRLRNEKRQFRAFFEHAMVGMARSTIDRRWLEVNPALCQMLGYSEEFLTQCDWITLTHPDDRELNVELFNSVLQGERDGFSLEKRFLRPDGSVVFVSLAARAIRLASGDVDYFTVVIEDITQRQVAEKLFTKQVNRSMLLIDLPRQAELMDEPEFMRFALERAEALTGSRIGFMHFINDDGENIELAVWSSNTTEQYCTAVVNRHYPISEAGIWADAARTGQPVTVNDYAGVINKQGLPAGHSHLLRLLSVPVVVDGSVRMLTGVGNKDGDYDGYDCETVQLIANETWRIVCRQRTDKALRLAMQVVNASPVVCFRWAASNGWPVVFVSENVSQWGYTPEQLQADQPNFAAIVHPDDLARVGEEVMNHTAAGATSYEQEYRLITADNRVIWVVDRSKVTRDVHGLPLFYDGVLTDITERKQQQLLIADNLAHQQQLNKRLEEANNQLLQSEKMASIGQLAAGIAHELNNPIGFVHSNLGTLSGYLDDLMTILDAYADTAAQQGENCPNLKAIEQLREERDFDFVRDDIFKLLAESKDGISRVRKIVQDLKTFARVGEQEWQEADLHQGLDSTLNIVWNELKYKCQVIKEYGDIPPVYCLISQLNQVFMNLLVNAGHAIEHKGTITIRTRRQDADKVIIEIADTGKGIPPENLRRIFEPFFTTKPVGQGTGLGLSVSYNIVQRHQGQLTVDSEPGRGSTFRITLPVHPVTSAAQEKIQ